MYSILFVPVPVQADTTLDRESFILFFSLFVVGSSYRNVAVACLAFSGDSFWFFSSFVCLSFWFISAVPFFLLLTLSSK